MLLRLHLVVAALAALRLVGALDMSAWQQSLMNSIKNQVQNQIQATVNENIGAIASKSAEDMINSQMNKWTSAQTPAKPTAPAAPAAPAAPVAPAAPAAPVVTQQAAQPAANQPAANNAPAATQPATVQGGSNSGSNVQEQPANNVAAGGDVVENYVVVDGTTYNAADIKVSTLQGGQVVTLAGVSTLFPPPTTLVTSALTDAQGRTITGSIMTLSGNGSKPVGVKTLSVGDTDLTGNNTSPSSGGLSKPAAIGLGAGLGALSLSAIGAFFLLKWLKKKKSRHGRAPSIIISAPLEAKQSSETNSTRSASPVVYAKEMDGVSKVPTTDPSLPPSSTRSPVSPWTPGSATTGSATTASSHSPTARPGIYEMMGSEPVEMAVTQPAGAEMAASEPPAQELNSAGPDSARTQTSRPFSYVETPKEAFVSKKNPKRDGMVDINLKDNRV